MNCNAPASVNRSKHQYTLSLYFLILFKLYFSLIILDATGPPNSSSARLNSTSDCGSAISLFSSSGVRHRLHVNITFTRTLNQGPLFCHLHFFTLPFFLSNKKKKQTQYNSNCNIELRQLSCHDFKSNLFIELVEN